MTLQTAGMTKVKKVRRIREKKELGVSREAKVFPENEPRLLS